MGQLHFSRYRERLLEGLYRAFAEEHTPEEIARSFALGTFITMLPTLGTGLILFVILAYLFDWVSKLALLASVLVFNPIVKWGVYAASFTLGVLLLGPVEGVSMTSISFKAGPAIVLRLLVGNLILAILAAAIGYVVVRRLTVRYRSTRVAEVIEETVEEVAEVVLDSR